MRKLSNGYDKACEIRERLGLELELATSYNNIGEVYRFQGKYEQAQQWHNKAIEIQKRLGLDVGLAYSYNNLGAVYAEKGDFEESLRWLNQAREIQEQLGLEVDLAQIYTNIGVDNFNQGRFDKALFYVKKTIQLNDQLRSSNQSQISRQVFVQKNLTAVEMGIICGHQLSRSDTAFIFSEKAKSRGLLDLITEKGVGLDSSNIPLHLKMVYTSNATQLQAINQKLTENLKKEIRQNFFHLRDSLYQQRQELEGQIRLHAPAFANLIYPDVVDSKNAQAVLRPDEVLVSFFMGEVRNYAFVITRDQLEMVDLGEPDSLS